MSERFGLSSQTLAQLQSIFLLFPKIEQVLIYGSRAKGTHRPGSDIDMTIVGAQLSFSELAKIEIALDDLLLPYKIDLSLIHQIENPDLLDHINRVGQQIYSKSL